MPAAKVKRDTVLKVHSRFMPYGQVGGEIKREMVMYNPPVMVKVYGIEKAIVDTPTGKVRRSAIYRCQKVEDGTCFTVVKATDRFDVNG